MRGFHSHGPVDCEEHFCAPRTERSNGAPRNWSAIQRKAAISSPSGKIFSENMRVFDKPLIIFIDEFDILHPRIIDNLVGVFRDMYLDRENFCLHGLALIGVRAVLGVDIPQGSPFNIQHSLHVPNFTPGFSHILMIPG